MLINLGKWDQQLEDSQSQSGTTGDGDGRDSKTSIWQQLAEAIADGVAWLAGLVGLGSLIQGLGPAALVGVAVVALLAVRVAVGVVTP